jgi:hypothetical protein
MISSIELEEQRQGKMKASQVDMSYINSGEYRRKFDSITNDSELSRLLYSIAKEMLIHRAGTTFEDMYWIDLDTKKVVASVIDSKIERKIIYPVRVEKIVNENKRLITMHTHPFGLPPSYNDLRSAYEHRYVLSLVIGHNGRIFTYTSNEEINENRFYYRLSKFEMQYLEEIDAQIENLLYYSEKGQIYFSEVR